jgi:hypothetical protein
MALRVENGYPSREPGAPPRFWQPLPFVFRRGFPVVASAACRRIRSRSYSSREVPSVGCDDCAFPWCGVRAVLLDCSSAIARMGARRFPLLLYLRVRAGDGDRSCIGGMGSPACRIHANSDLLRALGTPSTTNGPPNLSILSLLGHVRECAIGSNHHNTGQQIHCVLMHVQKKYTGVGNL